MIPLYVYRQWQRNLSMKRVFATAVSVPWRTRESAGHMQTTAPLIRPLAAPDRANGRGRIPLREGCVMNSLRGPRDPRTGRVFGFQSRNQRENFMRGRARFCNGPSREMPRCSAMNRLGEPCKAARMRGRSTCFRHSGSAAAKRARLAAAHLSGDARPHPARRNAIRTQPAPHALAARSA